MIAAGELDHCVTLRGVDPAKPLFVEAFSAPVEKIRPYEIRLGAERSCGARTLRPVLAGATKSRSRSSTTFTEESTCCPSFSRAPKSATPRPPSRCSTATASTTATRAPPSKNASCARSRRWRKRGFPRSSCAAITNTAARRRAACAGTFRRSRAEIISARSRSAPSVFSASIPARTSPTPRPFTAGSSTATPTSPRRRNSCAGKSPRPRGKTRRGASP